MNNRSDVEKGHVRAYGNEGPTVIVLHGGPGARGEAAPIAEGLSDDFRVFEPWQRGSSEKPLTVAIHIEDLDRLVNSQCADEKPVIVGESWGAMLALAYAAEHSERIGPIVLIGCGTFDEISRAEAVKVRDHRIRDYIEEHPEYRSDLDLSLGERIMKWHGITDVYELDPGIIVNPVAEPLDMKAHTETWNDMLHCQEKGIYPQSFVSIGCSVIMLHGAYDPHPGKAIRDDLRQYMPQLEYREFDKCGHAPWIEKYAKDDFFDEMRNWIESRLTET